MEELDFRLLQGIAQSSFVAISYSSKYDQKLFLDPNVSVIAKPMLDYVKAYHSAPSYEALIDIHKNNIELRNKIAAFYVLIKDKKYNDNDYKYDLEKLKERFCLFKYKELKKINTESTEVQVGVRQVQSILNEIKGLNHSQGATRKSLKDYTPDFIAEYKAKQKNPEVGQGILTGYSYLDFLKNGFRPADLIMIAGESGAGKSMWLNNIAINMWMQKNTIDTPPEEYTQGYNVVYISLEMPLGDMYQRTISSVADVSSYGVRDAKNSSGEMIAISKATKFFKNYPHTFDIIDVPRGFTVEQLELQIEQIKTQYKPDVIFIDYLGLMDEVDDQEDWLKLGYLAGKIHEFARIYEVPVVTAVQMTDKRAVKTKDDSDKIGLHRIGRSGLIAHHATMVLQIETKGGKDDGINDFKYHIIKNRYGESGGSASIIKKFSHCKVIDKPYDSSSRQDYTVNDDISIDISKYLDEEDE
jgi:replicative DNA helicase